MAALQYVDMPGYAALLLRRTYAELSKPKALMDRAREWLQNTDAKWVDASKSWLFPSGATLGFGYMDSANDHLQYQSAEYQYVGFDELTHFTEAQYRYMFSRIRRLEHVSIPLRMRSASNPGGPGHEWVREMFVDAKPHRDKIFIPATMDDNTYLDRDEYEKSLLQLDPVTRAQLRDGNWTVRSSGNMFKREWFRVIDAEAIPPNCKWVRFWDLAGTADRKQSAAQAYTAGVLVGRSKDGRLIVSDVKRERLDPPDVQRLIINTASQDGSAVAIRQEQEPGSAGKFVVDSFARQLAGYDYKGVPATGSKEERARPFSAACSNGIVDVVRGQWNAAYFDELESFPEIGFARDQVDASSGAHQFLTTQRRVMFVS